ncbi:alpha-N-arabinofuranosidase [Hirschia baltica]|uniref:non-reducing end alpha-L-arabinofuranosidase n=1 Tax=Hirschia baltica (strain ATCC 49814 / DSM 5838 / IFAM 1418) TaxID=582402 RepID=C6XNM2_HIRBI|nr:alpha-L-arabinofuranosidase C-terminal domain-containing protein [Hirschia baltica]ACT58275.1 alpha-L-arabinofuranosidase domain protein [Hirschia baltica ATCC 49814]
MKSMLFSAIMAVSLPVAAAQTKIDIHTDKPIGTIQPEIYGQFLEHVGTQVYDGIWVGHESDIPNTDGIRNDVFEALSVLDIPVIRWPGGCYADLYHWKDGIGAQSERKKRVNMAWGGTAEPNGFGTHEFFNFAEKLGAKTYLNVNLASGTVNEASDWLEYITFDGESDLANLRRTNGRDKPWTIDYLSIGNETWGCGGHMRATAYADQYAQWATILKTGGEQPTRIISGSHQDNIDYSAEILTHPNMSDLSEGISLHYYTLPTDDWDDKGAALGFSELEWASTIKNTLKMEAAVSDFLKVLDASQVDGDFGLYVDEWGMWVNTEDGDPSLHQQNTIRDGVVAALNLNLFHDHADRIAMTNIAQMVNVLQAMILTDGPEMVLTPTYYVYKMYRPFQGAESYAVSMNSPIYEKEGIAFDALSVSAAHNENGDIVIALVNADPSTSHDIEIPVVGDVTITGQQLYGAELDAHNSFEEPDAIQPKSLKLKAKGGDVDLTLPARSVTVLTLEKH